MSRVQCPCSAVIERINDGKDEVFWGECLICQQNGGRYDRSPHWKEVEVADIHSDQLFRLGEHFKGEQNGGKNGKRKK